jgi:hypothetical protein
MSLTEEQKTRIREEEKMRLADTLVQDSISGEIAKRKALLY